MTKARRPTMIACESATVAAENIAAQLIQFRKSGVVARPWDYAELHNPWSRAAQNLDSWAILDICQNKELIALITGTIGPDVILFDTRLIPEPRDHFFHHWHSDTDCFPVSPQCGLTVILPLNPDGKARFIFGNARQESLPLTAGSYILMDARQHYRISLPDQKGLADVMIMRYFPATSFYLRDPACAGHQVLMERWPLLNYATAPLWLVAGEDHRQNNFVTGLNVRAGRWTANPAHPENGL